jgi:Lipase (class 3)
MYLVLYTHAVVTTWVHMPSILATAPHTKTQKWSFLQVLQCAHPPQREFRGRVPRVHSGFHACWHGSSVREPVLQCICDAAAARTDSSKDAAAAAAEGMRVLACGHSLGGAIASLAAMDAVRECGVDSQRVVCYTFGCPRIGNHAFAGDYETAVPDTWHVVNDQDVVVHGMKLWGWYKRNGHRVIVNKEGSLIVRPSHLELSLLQVRP